MSNSLLQRYRNLIASGELASDPIQLDTINALDTLAVQLLDPPRKKIFPIRNKKQPPLGLYIWGPVGRGKTLLMDLFCQTISSIAPIRLHFHRFMRQVHQQLQLCSGQKDPLKTVALSFSQKSSILCFDEFFVDNIGDAMLLGRLLKHLFQQKVTLVCTSNQAPDQLYPNGLHRDRFIPAIALLQQHTAITNLAGSEDHRLRWLQPRPCWFASTELALQTWPYHQLRTPSAATVTLCNRKINCCHKDSQIIWFNFNQLCGDGRSALDYIELAERFDTVFMSHVPSFHGITKEWIKARGTEDGVEAISTGERKVRWAAMDDPARRFISLIDELYDRRVNVIICSSLHAQQLYPEQGALAFQYQRTLSRLTEMGSLAYQNSKPIT